MRTGERPAPLLRITSSAASTTEYPAPRATNLTFDGAWLEFASKLKGAELKSSTTAVLLWEAQESDHTMAAAATSRNLPIDYSSWGDAGTLALSYSTAACGKRFLYRARA